MNAWFTLTVYGRRDSWVGELTKIGERVGNKGRGKESPDEKCNERRITGCLLYGEKQIERERKRETFTAVGERMKGGGEKTP